MNPTPCSTVIAVIPYPSKSISRFYFTIVVGLPHPNLCWLTVGGWPTPLKNMNSSVGMMTFPIYGKVKFRFQTTNQYSYTLHLGVHLGVLKAITMVITAPISQLMRLISWKAWELQSGCHGGLSELDPTYHHPQNYCWERDRLAVWTHKLYHANAQPTCTNPSYSRLKILASRGGIKRIPSQLSG